MCEREEGERNKVIERGRRKKRSDREREKTKCERGRRKKQSDRERDWRCE